MTLDMRAAIVFVLLQWIAAASPAWAETYPSRPIKIVVAYSPGTGIDILARAIGQKLGQRLGQPVVVDNRPGASGNIGVEMVARAAPDGYTLAFVVNAIAMNPSLYKLRFDPVKDFAPIGLAARGGLALVVNPAVNANTIDELIRLARASPGKLTYASPGVGTPQHLAMELFKNTAAVDLLHVPHKGSAEAVTSLLSGQIDAMFLPVHTALAQIKGGKLRGLAVASPARQPLLPELPAVAESAGMRGFDVDLWYAMLAPAGTPVEIVARLGVELDEILGLDDIRAGLAQQGLQATPGTPDQLSVLLRSDIDKWARIIRAAGIKAE
jgi:tripartite-type tricarboxylate transporter receptor subunit TctC